MARPSTSQVQERQNVVGLDTNEPSTVEAVPATSQTSQVAGLIIHLRTMNENLDIRTSVFADVFHGDTKIANNVRIATGEVEEWQDHAPAPIPFVAPLTSPTGLSIELRHPGIRSNDEPHWRMSFSLEAVLTTGQRRTCVLTLQSSLIYVGDHGGQLNFVDEHRSSGRMPFLISF
jgi:hypothetical protein